MVYQTYYSPVYFQPFGAYYDVSTPVGNVPFQPIGVRDIAYRINEYFFRGLIYIQNVLDLLLSTSPFLDQYGPILEEVPKMYHLVKAINEVGSKDNEVSDIQVTADSFDGPAPRLYI